MRLIGMNQITDFFKYSEVTILKLVREQGVRDAVGITDGVSRVGDTLVTVPSFRGPLPVALGRLEGVRRLLRLIMEQTCRSTISQIPWHRASSTQFPAEVPLNSLMA